MTTCLVVKMFKLFTHTKIHTLTHTDIFINQKKLSENRNLTKLMVFAVIKAEILIYLNQHYNVGRRKKAYKSLMETVIFKLFLIEHLLFR